MEDQLQSQSIPGSLSTAETVTQFLAPTATITIDQTVIVSAPDASIVGISKEIPAATSNAYEALPADLKYFLHTHQAQCRAWAASHGNVNFPIYKDEKTGQWVWINREQRRRFRKFSNKKGPRL